MSGQGSSDGLAGLTLELPGVSGCTAMCGCLCDTALLIYISRTACWRLALSLWSSPRYTLL